jgi:hypothetical protein
MLYSSLQILKAALLGGFSLLGISLGWYVLPWL